MTTVRDTTRLISSWLRETSDALPDNEAFLDRWLDQLPAIEQRRRSHRLRRLFERRTQHALAPALATAIHPSTTVRSRTGRPSMGTGLTTPMRSAITFVAAAVVVASFGGFLVAGALTTQPVDKPVPAVATSPSPTASYVVTDISDAMSNLRDSRFGTHLATDDALWFSDAWSVYRMDAVSGEVTEIPSRRRPAGSFRPTTRSGR